MNPSPPAPETPTWKSWLRTHPYTLVTAAVFLGLSIPFCLRQDSEWQAVYVRAADHLRNGEDIYRPEDGYLYPPFMAWAALPFTALPGPSREHVAPPAGSPAAPAVSSPASLARQVPWLLLNLVCLAAVFRWAWRVAGGGRLQGAPSPPRGEHLAAVLGAACGIPYLENCLAHQQADVVIGALLVGGCLLLTRTRPLLAATCFGLAAACKCTALLWLPYLVWRGRPGAAAWVLCVALGVNLVPDLVSKPASGRPWLAEYATLYLRPLTASGRYVGTWGSDLVYNQSLAGAGQRWLATTLVWTEDDCTPQPLPNPVSPATLRNTVYAVEGALLLAVLWGCGRPFRRIEGTTGGVVGRQALECGVVLLLMLLLSPMSSKAHFGVLILPGFCLARAAATSGSHWRWGLVLTAVALGFLSYKAPLGERLYTLTLWYGSATWHTLVLLLGCLVVLRQDVGGAGKALSTDRAGTPCPAPPETPWSVG